MYTKSAREQEIMYQIYMLLQCSSRNGKTNQTTGDDDEASLEDVGAN